MSSFANREIRLINYLIYIVKNQTTMIKNIQKVTSKIDCRMRILCKSIQSNSMIDYETPPRFDH